MKNYLLYHSQCYDGFGAAWSFYTKYGNKMEYIPVIHGNPIPELTNVNELFIADFSYSRNQIIQLKEAHPKLVLIDHHLSAQRDLADLPFTIFNMNKSGAVLAWEYLFPHQPVPKLLQYVMDRDLWNFHLPHSRKIHQYISSYPFDFSEWDHLNDRLENHWSEVVLVSERLLKANQAQVKIIVSQAQLIQFHGHQIPCLNTSLFQSEVGHELLNLYPNSSFSLMWYMDEKNRVIASFRSRGDFDVSVIAKHYSGGGHRAAAGCRLDKIPGL